MKSKIKRLLALVLCLTMVLNGNVSLLASDEAAAEDQVVAEAVEEMMEEVAEEATEEVTEEVVEEVVEEETTEEVIEEVAEETEVVEQTTEVQEVIEEVVEEVSLLELTWAEDGVTVKVSEKVAGAIPEGTTLSVTPIVEGKEYAEVETQLHEKAADEAYEIAGFLAYDICLVDSAGNEIEPNDNVNVSIEYEEAVIPEMVVTEDTELDVTVMHFEEDENGEVAEIVDMVADENIEAVVKTTGAIEVMKAEFVTNSFSTYTVTWYYGYREVSGTIVDENGTVLSTNNKSISINQNSEQISISNISFENITIGDSVYEFKKAVVVSANRSFNGTNGTQIYSIRRYSGNYYAYDVNDDYYRIDNSSTSSYRYKLYFVYGLSSSSGDSSDTETGVTLTLNKTDSAGAVLAGARFTLYNTDGTTIVKVATSAADGSVTMTGLAAGNYVLKETQAPEGYIRDKTVWNVTVTSESAVITVPGSSDAVTTVVNYTEAEQTLSNLTSSKTASAVINDTYTANDRVYQIDITASTTGQSDGTSEQAATIILALDASSSMDDNNAFKSLKDAIVGTTGQNATQGFIDKIASVSPSSKMAIVWYNGSEDQPTSQTNASADGTLLPLNSTNVTTLKSFVSTKNTNGGTPMGDGLEKAYDILKTDTTGNPKYVLFFTDGMPGYWSGNDGKNCMVANKAVDYAAKIKSPTDGNATLYTIGYNLSSDDTFSWNDLHTANENGTSCNSSNRGHSSMSATSFLSTKIATSSAHAYLASNIGELKNKFDDLASELGQLFNVDAERIVDVIDSRFELTEESKNALIGTPGVTVTENTDGTTTIEWTGDAAKIGNSAATGDALGAWIASFNVQAKSDFIGGNMIPTNGPTSGIYVDSDTTIYFEQPSVNVKLLNPILEGSEYTIYKGDESILDQFVKQLVDTFGFQKYYKNQNDVVLNGNSNIPELEPEQIELLKQGDSIIIEYSYGNTDDVVGLLIYEYNSETATLTVTFDSLDVLSRNDVLLDIQSPTDNGGTPVEYVQISDNNTIQVISGEIQITKTLKEVSTEPQTFNFLVIKDQNSNDPIKVSITVPANQTSASVTLEDLARGSYKITEADTTGYVINSVDVFTDLTNCQSNKVETELSESVTFVLGNDVSGVDVIKAFVYDSKDGGTLGAANFTNEEAYKDWTIVKRSSSDNSLLLKGAEFELRLKDGAEGSVWYKGVSQEDGTLKWFKNGETELAATEYISKGVYILTETKAPAGYSLTGLTWTVTIATRGYLKNIECSDKQFNDVSFDDNGVFTCFIENTPLYELPQSGGLGIYTYTIGGILLMAFATLILYKNRRKEVLAR